MSPPTVTAPIALLPIQTAPLPWQFRFKVHYSSTQIPRHKIYIVASMQPMFAGFWPLADQDVIDPCGFSQMLCRILHYAGLHNLWGQTIRIRANYPQPNGAIAEATQSDPQDLELPLKPLLLNGMNKIQCVGQLPCGLAPPPQGLRLLWAQLPADLSHNAWYVGQDKRLSGNAATLSFDRFSFWISALGLPIKSSAGIQTGEAFANLIGALRYPVGFQFAQASVAQIEEAASADASIFNYCIFWNATRLLLYHGGFFEFGPGGFGQLSPAQFASGQVQDALWNVRLRPKLGMTWGQASVM
ncbi:hypothetical protein LJR090_005204 [Bosea sp. LjRoot90]|uniref:hypothetical protein n=1 Tax=Bosea sp. LjRoot90 TaxID=3342342 RepID=UPI003ECFF410